MALNTKEEDHQLVSNQFSGLQEVAQAIQCLSQLHLEQDFELDGSENFQHLRYSSFQSCLIQIGMDNIMHVMMAMFVLTGTNNLRFEKIVKLNDFGSFCQNFHILSIFAAILNFIEFLPICRLYQFIDFTHLIFRPLLISSTCTDFIDYHRFY